MKGPGRTTCLTGVLILVLLALLSKPAFAAPQLDTSNALSCFTNLASRLLKSELNLDPRHLQIYPTNQCTPSVHRLLQLSANICDAINPTNDANGAMPRVFRPVFETIGNEVYIKDYIGQGPFDPLEISPQPVDLSFSNAVAAVQPTSLIFGVPFVIGARKGLPNFNEFSSESVVQITRKLELRKTGPGGGNMINQTNQIFVIGISNVFGAEFWNAYPSNYTRPVEITVINFSLFALTNDYGYIHPPALSRLTATGRIMIPSGATNSWPAWTSQLPTDGSFLVPLRSNHIIIPDLVYSHNDQQFKPLYTPNETSPPELPMPRWGLALTNRVVAYIRDQGTGRLIDFVQLASMASFREVTKEMAQPATAMNFDGLWATNALAGATPGQRDLSDRPGVINQIQISKGDDSLWGTGNWQDFGINQPAGRTKSQEIAKFKAFFMPNNQASYRDDQTGENFTAINTNLVATAPFSPTWKQSVPLLWQANDPLVHYTAGDMEFLERSGVSYRWRPSNPNSPVTSNLGKLNERYRPWGGNPFAGGGTSLETSAYNVVLKDPLVRSARNWDFPEGEPLSLAMMRRVHRGTPWQTVYLKSASIPDAINSGAMQLDDWPMWLGNRNVCDAEQMWPTRDWKIVALIASLINTNDPRALLSVNERDANAWLATLDGLVAITNSSADLDLTDGIPPQFNPASITTNSPPASILVAAVRKARTARPNQYFRNIGDLLAVPELSVQSPWLNRSSVVQLKQGISDEAYETVPAQLLARLRPDSIGSITPDAAGWRVQFTGFDGFRYAVEHSTSLIDWLPVSTNEPIDGVFEFALPGGDQNGYYRSLLLP